MVDKLKVSAAALKCPQGTLKLRRRLAASGDQLCPFSAGCLRRKVPPLCTAGTVGNIAATTQQHQQQHLHKHHQVHTTTTT
jgi:hypothetical protein